MELCCIAVVLMEDGEVYTFGSNQFGQLGTGDTTMRLFVWCRLS